MIREAKTKKKSAGGISDDAVTASTGKSWSQWFSLLDRAGAKKKTHQEIVAILSDRYRVGSWWRQMVTVAYEQERGLRDKHEKPDGYSISRSRTLAVPAAKLFRAWNERDQRHGWLPQHQMTIRKATKDKSLRITWSDDLSHVEVQLYPKLGGRTQVTVQHSKLADAQVATRMKEFWSEALDRLRASLEATDKAPRAKKRPVLSRSGKI